MKTLFTTLILLFFASAVFAQDDAYYSPEKKIANKIIIETRKPKAENLKLCVDILTENEIVCEQNKETFIVKTDIQNTKKRNYPYYLNFFCKDSVIVVSGKFKLGVSLEIYGVRSEDNFEQIQNNGMKGSAYRITFDEMKTVAEKFGKPINF
ncbi:MAG TPA: hypothetical protein PKH68_01415 [Paludibacteraceae bacterium]|nr:hypothetical protein [Paludibacteraceae bacterium]